MTDPTDTPLSDPSPPPAKVKRRRRTWRQRLKILILILLIGVGLFRIALNLVLPTVIDKVAGLFGLECGYQRLSLSFLGGTAHVWGLEVRPKEGGDSIATCDYIEGNLSPLELLRGRLVVYRAEVDGVAVTIERAADGSIPLLQKFVAAQGKVATPAATPTPAAASTKPYSLDAPLRVDAVRVTHVSATLRDRSVTPTFEATVRTNVRVSDVGLASGPAKFELEVGVDPVLDVLRVVGEAHTSPTSLKADVQVMLRGLHPKAAAGYLAPLGLRAVADSMSVQANASVTADTIPNSTDIKATIALDHITALADGQQWASLGSLTLDAPRVGASGVELGTLAIADGSASAKRTADGKLQAAGLELAPVVAAPTTRPAATQPAAVAVTSGPPFNLSLAALDVRRFQANVTDEAVRPAVSLVARLDRLGLTGLDTDPAHALSPVPLTLTAGLPGVVESLTVTGPLTPFAPAKTATLAVAADGIRPDALRPYLDRLGLVSQLGRGSFTADVAASVTPGPNGAVTADASATGVRFADGDTPLVEMKLASLFGLAYTPADGAISVKSIDLAGPTLRVVRDADGHVAAAGFKLVPPPATPAQVRVASAAPAAPATNVAAVPQTPLSLPRIEIGQVKWGGVHLTLEDQAATPATTFTIDNAGLELTHLLLDLKSDAPAPPGNFVAYLAAPGLAQSLIASGTFTPGRGQFTVDAIADGDGLSGERIAGYVRGLGIEPTLTDGRLHAQAKAVLTQTETGLGVGLDVTDATYSDAGTELAGVDALHLDGLEMTPERIDLAELTVKRPRVRIAREANGAFVAGGVRLLAAVPSTQPAAPTTAAAARPAVTPFKLTALPIELGLKKLRVEQATLDWADAVPATPVAVHVVAGVSLDDLNVAPDVRPATLHATAAVDGVLGGATVDGTVTASPVAPAVDLKIVADGLAAGPLAAYVPPTLRPTLTNGHFETALTAAVSNHDAGGLTARLAVAGLKLTDAGSPPVAAAVDAFTLTAARIDPAAGVFSIDELSGRGVAADVSRTPAGEIEALGVRLVAAPPPPASTQPVAPPATAPSAAPVASLASIVGDARRALPRVTIGTLDLGVRHFGLAGFTGPDAAPVAVRDMRVTAPGRLALGGRRPDADPPVALKISGGLDPIVGGLDVSLSAKPFENDPSLALDVQAHGIRGDGLLAVLPALKPKIDGSQLTDGTFTTHVDASAAYGRRGPRDFDLGRGFTAAFDVKPLEFRGVPDGPVLAGVASLHGDGIKVDPLGGNVTVKTLDVATPTGRVFRDDAGIHACGLTLLLRPEQPVETLTPASQPAEPRPAGPKPAPVAAVRPTNEIRLDRFTVTGVDALIEDRTTKPATVVPLKSLDVDVRDLSSQLPWSGKFARFSVLVTSDKVPLPPRKGARGEASTQPVGGAGYTEMRELFQQVTADGKIGFARSGDTLALDGWTKTSVNGFELLGVRGLAQQFGVTVGGGAFDDTNDVRFHPDGNIETKNKLVFTNLSLSEPANGPLRRLLKLPTPIDVAIGAVTDPDGSITLNLPVPIKNGALSPGDVVGPALGAVTNVLVTGIASAPLKAIGGVGNLLGFNGKQAAPEVPVRADFLPAYDGLDGETLATAARLNKALLSDPTLELQLRHTLTDADAARVGTRVNPSSDQALALAARVRRQKADLLQRHETLTAQARGDLGSAAADRATATLAELRDVDTQLARAEASLDELYALTGPGAAGQADRRTRAACLDLARRRLDALTAALARTGPRGTAERVHATNPQFDPAPEPGGGYVTITLVRKKH